MFFRNKGLRTPLLVTAVVLMLVMSVGGVFASQVMRTGEAPDPDKDTAHMNYAVTLYDTAANQDAIQNGVFRNSTSWCPGRTEIAYLTLTNGEKFPVEVDLSLVNVTNGFDGYLTYALLEPAGDINPHQHNTQNWAAFKQIAQKNGTMPATKAELPMMNKTLAPGETYSFAFAVHMAEGTPDSYQQAEMNFEFGMTVTADFAAGADPSKSNQQGE